MRFCVVYFYLPVLEQIPIVLVSRRTIYDTNRYFYMTKWTCLTDCMFDYNQLFQKVIVRSKTELACPRSVPFHSRLEEIHIVFNSKYILQGIFCSFEILYTTVIGIPACPASIIRCNLNMICSTSDITLTHPYTLFLSMFNSVS